MTSRTAWWGPALDGDEHDVQAMLDSFVAAHELDLDDDPVAVTALIAELADLGIWTVGTSEAAGGGGAGRRLTAAVFERLGHAWPALGWASVQAHAAVDLLGDDSRFVDLITRIHAGAAAVAVVDTYSSHVRLTWVDDTVTGVIDRVDAASEAPHLLVLDGADTAVLIAPEAARFTPQRRTGLGGALTRSAEIDVSGEAVHLLTGIPAVTARIRLHLGAAAVAAGIAGAATDAAAAYAADRRQFGDVLTTIPTVRQNLFAQATGSVVALAPALGDSHPVHALAAARHACDSAIDIAAAALQSHGGYGYLTEYGAERRLRDAVSLRAAVDTQGAGVAGARALVGQQAAPAVLRKDAS
ncbi:acyl-CoA dehydrogenase family protein [Rhodococcus rhodochrous]|uniref:acyl-CoA dehydrogenase family protein n=1 Tax=Rhodococcus rhodochrous TaxID=1829 RepID=UPI0003609418|nr:acyl-CoA dehydrogenase family protein [Rhodococcus rhodochrous]